MTSAKKPEIFSTGIILNNLQFTVTTGALIGAIIYPVKLVSLFLDFRNILKFYMPYQRFNRVEVQYLHDFAGITGGVSLAAQPLLNFSCVVGNSLVSIGADLSFDTATTKFAKCNAGFSFNSSILVASLAL